MNDWRRYRSSRFPLRLYLPLAILLCTAANVSAQSVSLLRLGLDFLLACSLLFQFRLWDDLSDVRQDGEEHPERVLSQATSLSHFRWLLMTSLLMNVSMVAIMKPFSFLLVFLSLNAVFLMNYQSRGEMRRTGWVCYHVVLSKYPVFVYLLSPPAIGGDKEMLGYAMAMVYFCFCVFEILHDEKLHAFRCATTLLGLEMVAFIAFGSLVLFRSPNIESPALLVQAIIACTSLLALATIFSRYRHHIAPGRWCYTVFLLSFLWLLDCIMIRSELFRF